MISRNNINNILFFIIMITYISIFNSLRSVIKRIMQPYLTHLEAYVFFSCMCVCIICIYQVISGHLIGLSGTSQEMKIAFLILLTCCVYLSSSISNRARFKHIFVIYAILGSSFSFRICVSLTLVFVCSSSLLLI